jgi:hypothetical protein
MGPLGLSPHLSPFSMQLKDLKRQLHLERKRADKLQERLQDILTNSKSRSGETPGQAGQPVAQGLPGPGPVGYSALSPALWPLLSVLNSASYLSPSLSLLFLFQHCFFLCLSPFHCLFSVPVFLCLCLILFFLCFLYIDLSLSVSYFFRKLFLEL